MKKYNVCSKLWTDLNINFQRKTFQHCCKQTHTPISIDDLMSLKHNVFQHHPVIVQDRKTSLEENKLPQNCKWCIDTAPNNIMKIWNIWDDEWVDKNRHHLTRKNYNGYIDLDIGKSCDLACIYCGPWSSTTWAKELEQPVENTIDAEWKDKILKYLSLYLSYMDNNNKLVFNILGGEPLLITDTYDIISYLARNCKHFNSKPDMMITTNLNCKPALLKKLLDTIEETKDVFNWVISVSIEDVGERAEAVRYHVDFNRFENNLKSIKDKVDKIYLTTTFSILSFANFHEFIEWSFDILGQENYTKTWDYSLNNVQQGYTDLAYCPKELVDVDCIKKVYMDKVKNCHNRDKIKQVIDHIDNMYNRAGTIEINDKFIGWWDLMILRRNLNYKDFYPLNKIL
jgi:hypothetical protein